MKQQINSKIKNDIFRLSWHSNDNRNINKMWLDKNENTDKNLSVFIKNILVNLKSYTLNSYPELSKLYLRLAKFIKVSPKNILLTQGSDGGIKSVFETFVNPKDYIIRTEPTFAMYSIYSKIYKTKEILINYRKDFSLDVNLIIKNLKLKKPKLLCLPNPDSPTGQVISEDKINLILRVALKNKTFVLLDEAYFEYYKKTNILKINKYPNLIVVRTTAKAYGLSGLRVGYLVANNNIITKLHQTKPMYEINYLGAEIFYNLLSKKNNNFIKKIVNNHLAAKKYFVNEIKKMKYKVTKTFSNFIIVDFDLDTSKILLKIRKICYFKYYNNGILKGKVRFSLTDIQNFKKIIKTIKKAL
jgi:histidinol-phosphate aminotransferase